MIKIIIIIFILIFTNISNASTKKNIINNFKKINNLSFNFIQTIDGKDEKGDCIINYPKKIYCSYKFKYKKVLVSNGKSLVIKSRSSYYRYPLEKTPLNFILDKTYLISKIFELSERIVDKNLINFTIQENNNEINIFFDLKSFDLIGWQTQDIYQNLSITYINSILINQKLKKNQFKLPTRN